MQLICISQAFKFEIFSSEGDKSQKTHSRRRNLILGLHSHKETKVKYFENDIFLKEGLTSESDFQNISDLPSIEVFK